MKGSSNLVVEALLSIHEQSVEPRSCTIRENNLSRANRVYIPEVDAPRTSRSKSQSTSFSP